MYKIYINNAPLVLIAAGDRVPAFTDMVETVHSTYLGKPKFLFQYIDYLEKQPVPDKAVVVQCMDVIKAFNDFCTLYEIIEAGGGVVKNPKGEVLMIFRRGFWDLPKGKMDPGENMMQTAAREVKEETGLTHIQVERHLTNTYHTYRTGKGKRVLKICTWFEMRTLDTNLVPQLEEDIEEALWVNLKTFLSSKPKIFKNIVDVLRIYSEEI